MTGGVFFPLPFHAQSWQSKPQVEKEAAKKHPKYSTYSGYKDNTDKTEQHVRVELSGCRKKAANNPGLKPFKKGA